jgi:hypothetical protein
LSFVKRQYKKDFDELFSGNFLFYCMSPIGLTGNGGETSDFCRAKSRQKGANKDKALRSVT